MFRCPWIFRALTSLNKVIITKELKMMVKCCVGGAWIFWYFPSSISNKLFPERDKHNYYLSFWNYNLKLKFSNKNLFSSYMYCAPNPTCTCATEDILFKNLIQGFFWKQCTQKYRYFNATYQHHPFEFFIAKSNIIFSKKNDGM